MLLMPAELRVAGREDLRERRGAVLNCLLPATEVPGLRTLSETPFKVAGLKLLALIDRDKCKFPELDGR